MFLPFWDGSRSSLSLCPSQSILSDISHLPRKEENPQVESCAAGKRYPTVRPFGRGRNQFYMEHNYDASVLSVLDSTVSRPKFATYLTVNKVPLR